MYTVAQVIGDVFVSSVNLDTISEVGSTEVGLPQRSEFWEEWDVRRHWTLTSHCQYVLFPCVYPSLNLPSKFGTYLWHKHITSGVHQPLYCKKVSRCIREDLRNMTVHRTPVDQVIVPDQLMKISSLDHKTRTFVVDGMEKFFRNQRGLLMVSLEMIKMDRREVVRLLVALGEACGHTLRRVYLWGTFAHDQNPFLEDNTPDRYRGLGAFKMRMTSRCQYLDVWSKLSSLTVLALNYGYLSDQRGNVLLVLASVLNGRLATLQLLCLEDEIPNKYGGHAIPDRAWKTVLESCPGLQVHLVVDSMAEHSMVRSFISPSIPVHQFALFSGIQLERKRQWDMDVTFRVLEKWYSDRLEVVLVHLYRNNEFLDRTLVKLLTALPRLTCLELIGIIRDVDNVEKMCEILSRESLKLEKLRVCVQDGSNEGLKQKIEDIQSLYMEKLLNKGVKIDLTTYKL